MEPVDSSDERRACNEVYPAGPHTRNPETQELLVPNPFDNTFIAVQGGMSENAADKIEVTQPVILMNHI